MVLKSRVLRADPFEENIGRILLFGHLHAHGIERALGLTASHGDCVYLGILCELYLADSPVYTTVRGSLEPLRGVLFREFVLPSVGLLENAYAEDPYDSYRSYQAIAVSGIGCYSDPSKAILRTVKVEWHDIRAALEAVSSALELKSV
jgi:hypothetical protein